VHIERLVLQGLPPNVDVVELTKALEAALAGWFSSTSPAGVASTAVDRARPAPTRRVAREPSAIGADIAAAIASAVQAVAMPEEG
jgi:hypothetical protein